MLPSKPDSHSSQTRSIASSLALTPKVCLKARSKRQIQNRPRNQLSPSLTRQELSSLKQKSLDLRANFKLSLRLSLLQLDQSVKVRPRLTAKRRSPRIPHLHQTPTQTPRKRRRSPQRRRFLTSSQTRLINRSLKMLQVPAQLTSRKSQSWSSKSRRLRRLRAMLLRSRENLL